MLNLLFISNNPKMDFIKKTLQPMLKVKIDVVTDFDHGLQDVFEKRPATIIIQDQISGVTGESVARHIQMLLGSGAPTFVLMHEGNTRTKPIKGLFEYIVDLTHPDIELVEDIKTILKSILGSEWEKILIKPKRNAAALAASLALSDDSRVDADQLVDDFLFDMGTTGKSGQEITTPQPTFGQAGVEEPLQVESSSDELTRLLVESTQQANVQDMSSADSQSVQQIEPQVSAAPIQPKQKEKIPRASKPATRKSPQEVILPETPPQPDLSAATSEADPAPEPSKVELSASVEPTSPASTAQMPDAAEVAQQVDGGEQSPVTPSPADFRVTHPSQVAHEQIPEDLLLAFEENYRSQTSTWKRLVIVVVVVVGLGAGGWVLLKQKPTLLLSKSKTVTSPPVPAPETGESVATSAVKPPIGSQKPISTVRKPAGVAISALPSFMSTARLDASFTNKKPGWERYVGKMYEYRLFRSGGNIKVVQVLAGIGTQAVNDKFLATVLQEIVGNVDYSVNSSDQKENYLIQRGSVGKKADLLIYRSKKTSTIRAFVVSLN